MSFKHNEVGSLAWYIPSKISLSAPQSVRIEVTRLCNCKCIHCLNESSDPLKNELSTKELLSLIDKVKELIVPAIGLTGGEPFLREDFMQVLKYATKGDNFLLSISTNGSIMTERIAKFLADKNVDIQVSLDFATPEKHDKFRNHPGLWVKVKKTLELLVKYKAQVSVSTVLMALNTNDEIEKLISLLESIRVQRLNMADVLPFGRALKNWKNLAINYGEFQKRFMSYLEYLKKKSSINISYNVSFDFFFRPDAPARRCPGGSLICAIRSDGSVAPCQYFPPSPEDTLRKYDFEYIWKNSTLFNKFRKGWLISECSECPFWLNRCVGGCRALSYILKGDFYAPNECPFLIAKRGKAA